MIMPTNEPITGLTRRIELLAPAGRGDALEAVIEAGADAVYLGTKTLNMRQHRKDFHFDQTQLRQAADLITSIDAVGADAINSPGAVSTMTHGRHAGTPLRNRVQGRSTRGRTPVRSFIQSRQRALCDSFTANERP